MAENLAKKYNVVVAFMQPTKEANGTFQYALPGYLSDEGLSIELNHDYSSVMEQTGTIFDSVRNIWAGAQAIGLSEGDYTGGTEVKGYIQGGIMLNSPFLWVGTKPININLTMYQIAESKGEIIQNYQNVLRLMSPSIGALYTSKEVEEAFKTMGNLFNVGTMGPSLLTVYYFPSSITETSASTNNGISVPGSFDAKGGIQFQNCLCNKITVEIKAPFDILHSPIIGEYKFSLQTARILDSTQIVEIFKITEKAAE